MGSNLKSLGEEQISRRVKWLNRVRKHISNPKRTRGADHVGPVLDGAAKAAKKLRKAGFTKYERDAAAEAAGQEVERVMKENT